MPSGREDRGGKTSWAYRGITVHHGATVNWQAITAISSVVQALIFLIAAVVALWQVAVSISTRQMTGFLRLIDELERGSGRHTRQFFAIHRLELANLAQDGNFRKLNHFLTKQTRSSGQPLSLSMVLDDFAALEHVAMLCIHGMLPVKLERIYFATIVVRTWPNIRPVVIMMRRERGAPYMQHFEAMYQLCINGTIYKWNYRRLKKREARRLLANSKQAVLSGS